MNILLATTDGEPVAVQNIARIRGHGTSVNSQPPPATITLTTSTSFNWLRTSSGLVIHYPGRARLLQADGRLIGYV